MDDRKKNAFKLGVTVLVILAVLTVVEYLAASFKFNWAWLMFLIAIAKAYFVVNHYMHFPRLLKAEEEH